MVTNLPLLPAYGIDQALRLIPPPTGSVVEVFADIFGSSPRYIIRLELMGLVVFLLLFLPLGARREP